MSFKQISRRKFMKNLGSGVLGTGIALRSIPAEAQNAGSRQPEAADDHLVELGLTVNGKAVRRKIEAQTTLAELLRDHLNLTGTKVTCNHGACGACTVLLDGLAVYSCHMLALDAGGRVVTTIEGLMNGETLHPLQQAFLDKDGFQCGFCTPGQIMSAQAILLKNPLPAREDILTGMSGNLCRCAAYPKIADSVLAAANKADG